MRVGTLLLTGCLGLEPGTGRAMERVVRGGVNAHPGVGVGRMLRDAFTRRVEDIDVVNGYVAVSMVIRVPGAVVVCFVTVSFGLKDYTERRSSIFRIEINLCEMPVLVEIARVGKDWVSHTSVDLCIHIKSLDVCTMEVVPKHHTITT